MVAWASRRHLCIAVGISFSLDVTDADSLVHNTKLPVPHLEHPKLPHEPSLRVSFLDEQTVQTAHTVFTTQISYTFDDERGILFLLFFFFFVSIIQKLLLT